MVQKYRPIIGDDGMPMMIPDQQFGVWVSMTDYQMDLYAQEQDNQKKYGKAEGGFFDELDRLEKTNKRLHKQIQRMVEGLDDMVTGKSKRERETLATDYKDELKNWEKIYE